MYIGNDLQIANPSYKIIDDISSGFNGSAVSFALQVNGESPVPFPISTQQVTISVNGVIQEPDPSGSAGFKLLGSNIVFSSAPANGHAFFGVINAGADYVTAGSEFPDGSVTSPSFTFQADQDTGWFRSGSGAVNFSANGVNKVLFDGNGLTVTGTCTATAFSGNGANLTNVTANAAAAGTLTGGTLASGVTASSLTSVGSLTALNISTSTDASVFVNTTNANGAHIRLQNSGTTKTFLGQASGISGTLGNANDFAIRSAEDIVFSTNNNNTPNVKIDSSGRLLLGTTTEGQVSADDLTIVGSADVGITIRSGTSNNGNIFFSDGTSGADEYKGYVQYKHNTNALHLGSDGADTLILDNTHNATFAAQITVNGGFYVGGEVGLFNGSTNASRFIDCGLGDGNALTIRGCSGGDANHETLASFTRNGGVVLAFDNATKFQTTATGVTVTGTCTATQVVDGKGNLRDIPQNTQTSAYTLVGADAGKHIYISSGGVTVPGSLYGAGNAVTIINNSGSDQTITQGSGMTMYNTGDGSTGNRVLAGRGMATILFINSSAGYISGAGLS